MHCHFCCVFFLILKLREIDIEIEVEVGEEIAIESEIETMIVRHGD
jgi:hypothetical protein